MHKKNMSKYPFSSDVMCEEFFNKFIDIQNNKEIVYDNTNNFVTLVFLQKNKIQRIFTNFTLKQIVKKYLKRLMK